MLPHWDGTFDLSPVAKLKAESLALENKVEMEYIVSDLEELTLPDEYFDAVVLVFAHFDSQKRTEYHRKLTRLLKRGDWLILEAFNKSHLARQAENAKAGGPKDISMLYDMKDLKEDFPGFHFSECYQAETELNEELYHVGRASVVRILGTRKEGMSRFSGCKS